MHLKIDAVWVKETEQFSDNIFRLFHIQRNKQNLAIRNLAHFIFLLLCLLLTKPNFFFRKMCEISFKYKAHNVFHQLPNHRSNLMTYLNQNLSTFSKLNRE